MAVYRVLLVREVTTQEITVDVDANNMTRAKHIARIVATPDGDNVKPNVLRVEKLVGDTWKVLEG